MHLYLQDAASVKLLSHVQLFATPWTVAFQAPPSMEFSRQEYWSGLPFEETWNTERGNWSVLWVHSELMKTYLKPKLNNQIKATANKNPFPFYCKLMIEIYKLMDCFWVFAGISFNLISVTHVRSFFTNLIFVNNSPFEYFLPKAFVKIKLKIISIKLEKLLS